MKKIARNTAEILFACKNDLLETDIQQEKFDSIEKSTPINAEDLQPEIDFPVDKNELIVDLSSDKDLQPKQNGSDKKSIFLQKLEDYDLESDQDGIFQIMQGSKLYITNFSQVEFLYRKIQDEVINRVFSFDGISIELSPSDLMSKSSFNKKLLGCSCFRVDLSKDSFPSFINLLLSLDDGKIVENTSGFGQVTPEIFHLGNKVIINGSPSNFETPIWIGTKGFALKQTDTIKVSEDSDEFHNIWSNFHGLYGMQAILILGFAVATLFFQQLLNSRKFPLLYIRAASGRGKSCLAGFLCSLFGLNESFATINCAGNSTKIGIESKSLLLNNLPMILNEATEDNFNYMKSRFDGQGSVKFHRDKLGNILERSVKGPIVATTVVEPFDKQMVSRCVFIDLDKIIMNKKLYDEVQSKIEMLSCFATEILQNVSFDDLLKEVDKFTKTMSVDLKEPRILDNYCLLAGSFMVFKKLCKDISLPSDAELHDYITEQMKQAENYLNPLIHFIIELERLADTPGAQSYISQDNDFLYFNFNSVWSAIKDSYKKKHFPFMTAANIKELLKDSHYMAVYGQDLAPQKSEYMGEAASKYVKKINSISKRCYVVKRGSLPGYYR